MTPVVNPVTGEVIEGTADEIRSAALAAAVEMAMRDHQLPLFGAKPDAVQIAFGGSVGLDVDFESDAAFVQRAELGKRVSMRVTAAVVGGGLARKEGRKADKDTLTVKLRVESVELEDTP